MTIVIAGKGFSHDAVVLAHLLRGEVGVGAGTVPALDRLRVEGHDHAVLLGEPVQDVARHPQIVPGRHADGGPNLELPLGGHHLGVGARYRHAGIQATSANRHRF